MKKIRLVDQTEIEIYNITQSGDTLQIDILNGDATALEETFKDADNLSVIQYYIEEDLMIAYARFDQLQKPRRMFLLLHWQNFQRSWMWLIRQIRTLQTLTILLWKRG